MERRRGKRKNIRHPPEPKLCIGIQMGQKPRNGVEILLKKQFSPSGIEPGDKLARRFPLRYATPYYQRAGAIKKSRIPRFQEVKDGGQIDGISEGFEHRFCNIRVSESVPGACPPPPFSMAMVTGSLRQPFRSIQRECPAGGQTVKMLPHP